MKSSIYLSRLQMVKQPTRRANQEIYPSLQLHRLCLLVHTSGYHPIRLVVILEEFFGDTVVLESEFAGGGDDEDSGAMLGCEAGFQEKFDGGNEEG